MNDLGAVEDEIFKKRQQNEISFRAREKAKQKRMRMGGRPSFTPQGQFAPRVSILYVKIIVYIPILLLSK